MERFTLSLLTKTSRSKSLHGNVDILDIDYRLETWARKLKSSSIPRGHPDMQLYICMNNGFEIYP